jgi:hypothetical protein
MPFAFLPESVFTFGGIPTQALNRFTMLWEDRIRTAVNG